MLAIAPTFGLLLVAAAIVGAGSAIFHPESSRIARIASGGRHGFRAVVLSGGRQYRQRCRPAARGVHRIAAGSAWSSVVLHRGHRRNLHSLSRRPVAVAPSLARHANACTGRASPSSSAPHRHCRALQFLPTLIFSKYFYLASLTSYYTFYLISRFGVSVRSAQLHLFVFLGSAAAGTFFGGPIGDRVGPKYVIWGSILGVLPFTLLLPHANLFWTGILSAIIGFVIASAFSAIVVYAQELMPGRVGLVSGIFFGIAFGGAGIGAAVLGRIADMTSIFFVYRVCAYLPAIGLLTGLLPNLDRQRS